MNQKKVQLNKSIAITIAGLAIILVSCAQPKNLNTDDSQLSTTGNENQENFSSSDILNQETNNELNYLNAQQSQNDYTKEDQNLVAAGVSTLKTDKFKIYYPSSLSDTKVEHRIPVITWGNPTGFDSWVFAGLIKKVVQAEFVVVASHSVNTGRGTEMIAGIDLMAELNADSNSVFFNKLDLNNVGAFGHSQGGGGTTRAGLDKRVKATIPIYPYRGSGSGQHAPMFLLAGEKDKVCTSKSVTDEVFNTSDVPTVYAIRKGSNHLGPISVLGGDKEMDSYIVAWFQLQLKKDQSKKSVFFGSNCEICKDSGFIVQRK